MAVAQQISRLAGRLDEWTGFAKKPARTAVEVVSEDLSLRRTDRTSGLSQMAWQSTTVDINRLQACLRSAERGMTYLFYAFVRDMIAGFPHLNSEWSKRKMVIVGQELSLIPAEGEDDTACKVIREAIDNCRSWQQGLQHLLDATLFPTSASEKIWEPIDVSDRRKFKYLTRFKLKEVAPVSYTTFCYQVPYNSIRPMTGANDAQVYNADDWESWLRFYKSEPNGMVDYGLQDCIKPTPEKYIIHRGILQSTIVPPNWGGLIRPCLFLWLLSGQDRDWWALALAKYGMPIPVAKVNDNNKSTMQAMQSALALGMQLGGIAIPKNSELTWSAAMGADAGTAHKMFQDWLFGQISLLTVGQSTSARPEKGGLAAGMAEQSEAVRDDIRVFDVVNLGTTLKDQLFRQILDVNGYFNLQPPTPIWGGMSVGDFKSLAGGLQQGYQAGVRLTKTGIVTLNRRTGLDFEQIPESILNPKPQPSNKNGDK